eukprot:3043184-Pleurochrysis_carterae.AAC.2
MALKFDMFREGEAKFPPFEPDKSSAVEFLKAVLDSVVGTCITHNIRQSEAVVVQLGRIFLWQGSRNNSMPFRRAQWSDSRHFGAQRVPTPYPNTVKRLGAVLTRKAGSNKRVWWEEGWWPARSLSCRHIPKAV